jgi:uncharacterized membrane protein
MPGRVSPFPIGPGGFNGNCEFPGRRPVFRHGMIAPTMPSAIPKWTLPVLAIVYLIVSNLAFAHGSPGIDSVAMAILTIVIVLSIRGRHRILLRLAVSAIGILLIAGVATHKLSAMPLLLPPILLPGALAWAFGQTLMAGQVPLVERLARAVHAPEPLTDEMIVYTRRVTLCWALLLGLIALGNAILAANMSPGGFLEAGNLRAPWPVTPAFFGRLSNIATYLLIGGLFVVEYAVRLIRFPDYRFRNPKLFFQRIRSRLPEILATYRRE